MATAALRTSSFASPRYEGFVRLHSPRPMAPDSSKAGYVTLLGRKRSSTARRESEFRDLQETRETAVVAER